MKKIITIIISVCLMLSFCLTTYASNLATVSADEVNLSNEEIKLIPVRLDGNMGIMGFKITVQYPKEIDIKNVSRGELTSVGNFITNLGANNGTLDIVWNNTSNVKGDGTLFVLSAQANGKINNNAQINISFSQPDTFNESWEDVELNCNSIKIITNEEPISELESTTLNSSATTDSLPITDPLSTTDSSSTTVSSQTTDSSQIVDAVDIALQQNNAENLSNVENEEKFIEDYNKNLETITGTNANNVSSFSELIKSYETAYEDEFTEEVFENVEPDKVHTIINEKLKEYNVNSVDELKDEDKKEFVESVEKELKKDDADILNISNDLDTDKALEIIDKIYDFDSEQKMFSNKKIIVFSIVGIFVVALLIGIILKNKKHKF